MAREFVVRDAAGRTVRLAVDDAAEAVLRREGRETVLELADKIDPEPTHDAIRSRVKRTGESYELAAEAEFMEWEGRRQKREIDLSAGDEAADPTHEAIGERVRRTGESYGDAAYALATGEEEPSAGSGEATTTLSGDDAHHAIVAELSRRGLGTDRYGAVAAELAASGKIST